MNSKITKLIEEFNLGYTLGNAVRAIVNAMDSNLTDETKKIQHLKDARLFLNDEIRRLSKDKKK